MNLVIERHEAGPLVTLRVTGRLDAESAGELERALDDELRRGSDAIALDLAAVVFLSSGGIRVLISAHKAARAAAGRCTVSAASPQVRSVLALAKIDRMLMEPGAGAACATLARAAAAALPPAGIPADVDAGAVRLVGLERPAAPGRGDRAPGS